MRGRGWDSAMKFLTGYVDHHPGKHEPSCIHIPCTCISILRETNEWFQKRCNWYQEELKKFEKKLHEGLSCCCAGCSKHNQNIILEGGLTNAIEKG